MPKSPLHIVIERMPNREYATFHVNQPLCDSARVMGFFRDNGRTEFCKGYGDETNVEPLALMLADEIFHIDGVQYGEESNSGIRITRYTIYARYGLAFDENDIDFEVIVTIAGVLGIDLDKVTFELDNSARERQRSSAVSALGTFGI